MKNAFAALGLVLVVLTQQAYAGESVTKGYSQKTLLKNWALSRCPGQVYADGKTRADANASASAYLEFGRQPLEAYEALSHVIDKYANKKYAGSVHASCQSSALWRHPLSA